MTHDDTWTALERIRLQLLVTDERKTAMVPLLREDVDAMLAKVASLGTDVTFWKATAEDLDSTLRAQR